MTRIPEGQLGGWPPSQSIQFMQSLDAKFGSLEFPGQRTSQKTLLELGDCSLITARIACSAFTERPLPGSS